MAGLGNSLAARPRVAVFALVNGGGAGRGATRGHFFAHQHGEGMLSRRDFPHDQLSALGAYGLLAAHLRAGGRLGNVPHRFRCELVLAAFFAVDRIRSRFSHLRRQRRQRKKHNKRQRHHTNDFPGFHGSLPPNLMLMDIGFPYPSTGLQPDEFPFTLPKNPLACVRIIPPMALRVNRGHARWH